MAEPLQASIAASLRLSQALGLARRGRLREAQQLLAAEGTLPEDQLELHALAALATGEGDYSRALRLWRLLLQRQPGHAEAKHMIDCIELWLSRPPWFKYIPVGLIALGVGVLVSLVALLANSPKPVAAPVMQPYVAPVKSPARSYASPTLAPTVSLPSTTPPSDDRRRRTTR
jgi:hypothetical protein